MNGFIQRYEDEIDGVLNGFDRVLFRGTLRSLYAISVMDKYLAHKRVLYKDFGKHALSVSTLLKQAATRRAVREHRPIEYLASSSTSKEDVARQIALRDGIKSALICVLSCVEPCVRFDMNRCREQKQLVLQRRHRKCLHLYQYWMHPKFGLMHGRIQTWFPFTIQICLNGREWLARQMDEEGLGYTRRDNCFVTVENYSRAQELLNAQLQADWPTLLGELGAELNRSEERRVGKECRSRWSPY